MKRNTEVQFRLTEAEKELLQEQATAQGKSLSTFIRSKLFPEGMVEGQIAHPSRDLMIKRKVARGMTTPVATREVDELLTQLERK